MFRVSSSAFTGPFDPPAVAFRYDVAQINTDQNRGCYWQYAKTEYVCVVSIELVIRVLNVVSFDSHFAFLDHMG